MFWAFLNYKYDEANSMERRISEATTDCRATEAPPLWKAIIFWTLGFIMTPIWLIVVLGGWLLLLFGGIPFFLCLLVIGFVIDLMRFPFVTKDFSWKRWKYTDLAFLGLATPFDDYRVWRQEVNP